VALADTLFFVGDDAGDVTAFNAQTGQVGWGPTVLADSMVTGAPGGFFVQYGGPADAILVGTRNTSAGPSLFYALNLSTGVELPPAFDGTTTTAGLGQVMSTPTLDYATGRAYITSWRHMGTEPSVWCLQIKPDGTIDPTPVWTAGTPTLGDISASPVLANGRVYVANTVGDIYSLSKVDGTPGPVYPTGDGAVKGFLFPNRATGELFFATDTMVHSISDDGSGNLTPNWSFDAGGSLEPSIVLHWPNTDLLFVGSKDGTLWQVDFSLAPSLTATSQTLGDGVGHIGAPSMDIGLVPPDVSAPGNGLLLVGSESGALYAVEVPLP
jgi:outer membrane protein assembly factor BamB